MITTKEEKSKPSNFSQILKSIPFGYPSNCIQKEIQNNLLALCAFNDSDQNLSIQNASALIDSVSNVSDKVFVSIHWGYENTRIVSDRQKDLAHALIDSGADVIIGHGPHVIQELEIYKDSPIVYSVGNFIFDQYDAPNNLGLGVGVFLEKRCYYTLLLPIWEFENATRASPI